MRADKGRLHRRQRRVLFHDGRHALAHLVQNVGHVRAAAQCVDAVHKRNVRAGGRGRLHDAHAHLPAAGQARKHAARRVQVKELEILFEGARHGPAVEGDGQARVARRHVVATRAKHLQDVGARLEAVIEDCHG